MNDSRSRLAAAAIAALGLTAAVATASPTGTSLAIKFAADQPNGLGGNSTVGGAAGVLQTVNWNNVSGSPGTAGPNLTADVGGVPTPVGVAVSWTSSGGEWSSTGDGEENNTAPAGNDRNLMAGYLDTNAGPNGVNVTISNLSALGAGPYTVYLYHNGGVQGRGGDYTVDGVTQSYVDSAAFNGTYVLGEDYQVFTTSAPGNNSLVVTVPTTGGVPRAPLNAIEIVAAVPEPASLSVLSLGALGLLARRRSAR